MATYLINGRPNSELTAARVSEALQLEPSWTVEIGDRISRRGRLAVRSGWHLSSAGGPEDGVELSSQLERLLDKLHPRRDELAQLADDGYEMRWFCYLGSHATEHAAELPRLLLQRVLELPGDIWLDVYDG